MKKTFVILFALITTSVQGQNHFLGIKGSVSGSNVSTTNFDFETNFKTVFSTGFTYDYLFKNYFSAGIDILYEGKGFKSNILFTDEEGYMTEIEAVKYNYHYIALPLKIGFNYGKKLYGFASLGIIPSFLLNANIKSTSIYNKHMSLDPEKIKTTGNVKKFDLGGFAEIGGGYKFKEKYWLYVSFLFQHSFLSHTDSNYFLYSKMRHYSFTANIGFKYALTK